MFRLAAAFLFCSITLTSLVLVAADIEPTAKAAARPPSVPRELMLQPTHLSCVANCSPGGGGNTYCQGVFNCGPGSVCLSNGDNTGRCNSGNAGQK